MAAEVLVELTSFVGVLPADSADAAANRTEFELRPSLLCHCKDLRNLVSVRDYNDLTKLDEMKKWEVMNTSPTVEYVADGDGVPGTKPFYTPKVKVTFYLYRDATQPFLETLMPILFAIFTNTLNIVWADDFNEFLGNELAIGLTLVFLIPQLSENESFNDTFQVNHIYVFWVFLSLMVSSTVFPVCVYLIPRSHRRWRAYYRAFAIATNWLSLYLPFTNLTIYVNLKKKLLESPHYHAANSMTFRGRPGDGEEKKGGNAMGSKVPFMELCQFFDPRPPPKPPKDDAAAGGGDKKKKPKIKIKLNENTVHADSKRHLSSYAADGPRPWQLDAGGKCFRTGYSKARATTVADSFTPFPVRLLTKYLTPASSREKRSGGPKGNKGASIKPGGA